MTESERQWWCNLADATVAVVDLLEAALCCEPEEFMKRIKGYHPVTMLIDDEEITIHIRRMSTVEIQRFEDQMNAYGFNINAAREGRTEVPADINPQDVAQWLIDVISTNITLPPEQLIVENEDGTEKEIRTGADLIQQYGGRVDFLPTAVAFIWGENRLPEKHKTKYREAAATAVNSMAGIVEEPASSPSILPTTETGNSSGYTDPVTVVMTPDIVTH
jgi:hypothetical protein